MSTIVQEETLIKYVATKEALYILPAEIHFNDRNNDSLNGKMHVVIIHNNTGSYSKLIALHWGCPRR